MHRHLDPQEAQEVVRLAAAERAAPAEGPTIEGLAEALDLPPAEVERLLAQVRARRTASRSFGDRSAALSAALVLGIVLVVAICGAVFALVAGRRLSDDITDLAGAPPVEAPAPDRVAPLPPTPPRGVTIIEGDGRRTEIRSDENGTVTIEKHEGRS